MSLSYFVYFHLADPAARVTPSDMSRLRTLLGGLPGMTEGLIFTPTETQIAHYFPDDPPAPALALQLQFDDIAALEAVLRPDGALQVLAQPGVLRSLADAHVTEQAMIRRRFPVDEPLIAGEPFCSYLVHYPGEADDLNAWLAHYVDHHPPIMRQFPGVRLVEIYSRIDWCSFMPWQRVNFMQRNKLAFDTPAAFSAAQFSPVIEKLRADFAVFPPFRGGNVHYPLLTWTVAPE